MEKRALGCRGWITWSLTKMGVMIAVSVLILLMLVVYRYISCISTSDSANLAAENLAGTITSIYAGPVGLETEYRLPARIENHRYAMTIAPGATGILVNAAGTKCGTSTGGSPLTPPVIDYPQPLKNETEENTTLVIQNTADGIKIGKKGRCTECIRIDSFNYDGENGCNDPAEESVSFINTCPFDCDLTSWTISDWGNRHNYTFPECRLSAGNTLTLYTRCKTGDESDDDSKQFWCYTPPAYICRAIWNNDGDTLYLKDTSGLLALKYTYPEDTP